jgi:hypothetical protein
MVELRSRPPQQPLQKESSSVGKKVRKDTKSHFAYYKRASVPRFHSLALCVKNLSLGK